MRRAAQSFALVSCLLACGDGEGSPIRVSTLNLATGEYYGLSWGGTQDDRFYVVARTGASDGPAVILTPPERTPCELGEVARYFTLAPRNSTKFVLGSPSPARIQLFESVDAQGYGTLSFADNHCERTALTVENTSPRGFWTLYLPDLVKVKLAAIKRDQTLHLVDPWQDESEQIAEKVSALWPVDNGAWLIEHGELVKRKFDGGELVRMGEGVTELLPLGGESDIAYVDANGFAVVRNSVVKRLATDVCSVRAVDDFRVGAFAYFSPCDQRQLVVRNSDGKVTGYKKGVDLVATRPGRLIFSTNTETTTTLWTVRSDKPDVSVMLLEQPRFGVQDLWITRDRKLAVLAAQSDGTYTLWHVDLEDDRHPLTTVIEGITVRQTAPDAMATIDAERVLTLRNADGTRKLLEVPEASTVFRFAFGKKFAALAYLSHFDPETKLGRLELQFVRGEHFELARDVREFREVWWPERGIVYTVGGERAGLRFARIELPCETSATDYTTWGCGF